MRTCMDAASITGEKCKQNTKIVTQECYNNGCLLVVRKTKKYVIFFADPISLSCKIPIYTTKMQIGPSAIGSNI